MNVFSLWRFLWCARRAFPHSNSFEFCFSHFSLFFISIHSRCVERRAQPEFSCLRCSSAIVCSRVRLFFACAPFIYFALRLFRNKHRRERDNIYQTQSHPNANSRYFVLFGFSSNNENGVFFSVEKWIELYVASRVLREFENKPTKKNNKQINILNSVDCHETNERRRANNSRDSYFRNGVCVCGDTQHCHLRLIH